MFSFIKKIKDKKNKKKEAIRFILANRHIDGALESIGLGKENVGLFFRGLGATFGDDVMVSSKLEEMDYYELMSKYETFLNYVNKKQFGEPENTYKKEENILKRDIILSNLSEEEKIKRYEMIEFIWNKCEHSIKKEYETKLDLEVEENFRIKALYNIAKELSK